MVDYLFFDTSAIVKSYKWEIGSSWVNSLMDQTESYTVFLSEITLAEFAAAISAQHRAPNGISQQERDDLINLFLTRCESYYQLVPVSRAIIDRAVVLTQNNRLRGCDSIQLATAIITNEKIIESNFSPLTFVAADNDLLTAASAENLIIENPNLHS